jgi:hypothetical protein
MELNRQAFNIDFNLSKRTAVRSPAPPLQVRQRLFIMSCIESALPALSLRA